VFWDDQVVRCGAAATLGGTRNITVRCCSAGSCWRMSSRSPSHLLIHYKCY
ncbi:hypothetical protein NDU88_008023, partial [Pleurodeles waltl]